MSYCISTLLARNLHEVFGENDAARRRAAIAPPLATFEDSALIKLALEGQTECFTVLTNRHLPAVRRRIGLMVPNTTDADDLLQEVLLKIWRHLSTFRSESTFRTWMTRVAINEAFQLYRRQQIRPICQALGEFDTIASPHESPLQTLTRAETAQVIRKAIVALPAKYSQVLILRDLEELSERKTAQCLQSSIPAVKTRLFRARRMLLAALRRAGYLTTESAGILAPCQHPMRICHTVPTTGLQRQKPSTGITGGRYRKIPRAASDRQPAPIG